MATMPNRGGYYPPNPGQTPPIYDRSQSGYPRLPDPRGSGPWNDFPGPPPPGRTTGSQTHTGGYPPGQTPPIVPGQNNPPQANYQGFGIGHLMGQLGDNVNVPQGGFGFSDQQKIQLAPYMAQLARLAAVQSPIASQPSRDPYHLNMGGGVGAALQSLGLNAPTGGFDMSPQQQHQFMSGLHQFVTGLNRGAGGSPGKPHGNPGPTDQNHFPGQQSPGNPHQGPAQPYYPPAGQIPYNVPPQSYSPGNPHLGPAQTPPGYNSPGNRGGHAVMYPGGYNPPPNPPYNPNAQQQLFPGY